MVTGGLRVCSHHWAANTHLQCLCSWLPPKWKSQGQLSFFVSCQRMEVHQNKRPGYLILLSFWEQIVWLSLAWFAEEGRILSKQTRELPHIVFWEGVFGLHLLLTNGRSWFLFATGSWGVGKSRNWKFSTRLFFLLCLFSCSSFGTNSTCSHGIYLKWPVVLKLLFYCRKIIPFFFLSLDVRN